MNMRKLATIITASLLLSTIVIPAIAYPYNVGSDEISDALEYLRGAQEADGNIGGFATSAWAAMAISAAGEDPNDWNAGGDSIVDYLRDNSNLIDEDKATDYERQLLAIVASGENPKQFGGVDYVETIEDFYDGTQIDEQTLLNDDFWGIISLISAGVSEDEDIVQDAKIFIIDNQNDDGGWRFDLGGESTVDDTAAVIMALIAAGEEPSSTVIQDALDYLKSMQNTDGGFPEYLGGETNVASDAFAISAIVACGEDPTSTEWENGGIDAVDHILGMQQADGSFNWTEDTSSRPEWMTSLALIALLGETYPVAIYETEESSWSGYVRIEGESETIWYGEVTFSNSTIVADDSGTVYEYEYPSALGALDEAAKKGEFDYVVTDAYGFPYVESIAGEDADGMDGWLYRVDYISPMVGASDFELNETHEEVLWCYGAWGELPIRISSDKSEVDPGEDFTITVEYFDDENWNPLENATVIANTTYLTDSDGEVTISLDFPRTYEIWAEMEGYVRSEKIEVKVAGEGSSAEVNLHATILPAISINVSPQSIEFGELAPGEVSAEHEIEIENNGVLAVDVTADVTDEANTLFVDGLELDREIWSSFSVEIAGSESESTDARLNVPDDYAGVGGSGRIIFWAELA